MFYKKTPIQIKINDFLLQKMQVYYDIHFEFYYVVFYYNLPVLLSVTFRFAEFSIIFKVWIRIYQNILKCIVTYKGMRYLVYGSV